MNNFQKLTRLRLSRKFSVGDGVQLSTGEIGTVRNVYQTENAVGYGVHLMKEGYAEYSQDELTSSPSHNNGKYGGPSRGGSAGGWCGGNNYRAGRNR